jgi:hypothetical protein
MISQNEHIAIGITVEITQKWWKSVRRWVNTYKYNKLYYKNPPQHYILETFHFNIVTTKTVYFFPEISSLMHMWQDG